MPQNIEIKAHANHDQRLPLTQAHATKPPKHLHQHDTYFNTPNGRLKLRTFGPDHIYGELIHYHRDNQEEPTPSHYQITPPTTPPP